MLSKAITRIGIRIGNVFNFLVVDLMLELFLLVLVMLARLPFDYDFNLFFIDCEAAKKNSNGERRKRKPLLLLTSSSIGMIATTVIVQHFYEI